MKTFRIRPIKSQADYKHALSLIDKYFDAKRGTPEGDFVEVLTVLVGKYEEEHYPIGPPDPIEAIKFRMEQLGWTNENLQAVLGSKSRVSEILNRKRELSLQMIRKINKKMGVPAEVLIEAN